MTCNRIFIKQTCKNLHILLRICCYLTLLTPYRHKDGSKENVRANVVNTMGGGLYIQSAHVCILKYIIYTLKCKVVLQNEKYTQ